jgi:uncharacterized membrane protein YcjF (UPF0283 family)
LPIVSRRSKELSREAECQRILTAHGPPNFERISEALDRQFNTINNRAQLLLGICGVLISASVVVTTGRLIGRRAEFAHQHLAGVLFVAAGILEIAAAAVVVGGVLHIRWITQQPEQDLHHWVHSTLIYRDRKTLAYRWAIVLVLLSMISYQVAISIALLQL